MEAPNIEIPEIPMYDQKIYGINLEEFKNDEDITPELITPQLNEILQKLNLTDQFKGSIGEKLLNNPNFFSFMNNSFFPAENFFNKEVYSNPISMRNYIMALDQLLINILNDPSQLNKINGDGIDLSKLVKYMCVIFFRKPDLLKKIKKFIEKSFNIKQIKTLQYVLDNTSNSEWDLSKQTSQQNKRKSPTESPTKDTTSKKQKFSPTDEIPINISKNKRGRDFDSLETAMKNMKIEGEGQGEGEGEMLQEGGMDDEGSTSTLAITGNQLVGTPANLRGPDPPTNTILATTNTNLAPTNTNLAPTNTNLETLAREPNTLVNAMAPDYPDAVRQNGVIGPLHHQSEVL